MNYLTYKITTKVWMFSNSSSWHFVSLDKDTSQEIKSNQWFVKRGFGSVPVIVKMGQTKWETSIFPHKTGEYILPIKAEIRKKENITAGDNISFTLKVAI